MEPVILYYCLTAFALLGMELIYFKIAAKVGIVDRPNQRSSHTSTTIRGGGIIFFLAVLIWFLFNGLQWPWMLMGIMAVALISFLDDLKPRPAYLRFFIHLVGVLLVFFQTGIYDWSWMLVLLALIICVGALNAFNFMDGINGMTGLYALVNLSGFYVIHQIVPFSDPLLLGTLIVSVIVFLFFNFRNRATCFAGDVGSVTIALIQIFLLLQLIIATDNFIWVIMFLVYGIDSVVTILYRLKRRENIFKPHRTHLYQYLANEMRWPHRWVSLAYALLQSVLSIILIYSYQVFSQTIPIIAGIVFLMAYLGVRIKILRKILSKG
jgi:UDP-N-acetylmuramyl pentapeptide phosphotransferase/UDP-N-acetylglucosamine-1-phosphate transferase